MSLEEDINSVITESKIKFKTHKLRKAFVSKIIAAATPKDAPVNPEAKPVSRREQQNAVTKLVDNMKSTGHAIMTKGMSETNDEINKSFQAKTKVANSW